MTNIIEQQNHEYCAETIELKNKLENGFMILAERFYKIREEKLYEPFWETWQEYCFEFKNLSSASISKLCNIYHAFVVKYQIEESTLHDVGGWTVLAELLPAIRNKDRDFVVTLLKKIDGLSRSDARKTIKEIMTGKDMTKCKHKDTYVVRICRDCGNREEVFTDN